jgi:hypothetical protein
VATETRAERGHPPQAVRHGIVQRGLQNKINGRAADVAELAQDGGTVAHVGFGQFEIVAQRQNHVAPASVQNPAGNLFAPYFCVGERVGK